LDVAWAEQPFPFVTVSVRPTLPEAPAVYVIVWMFVALVIVPFVIDQEYVVAPAGPEAVLPVEFAQTCAGEGVIVGMAGRGLIGTLDVAWAEQPEAFVTVRVSPTLPEAPAVYVIVWMFVALVIVPFVIDHE
jgi:F0F1-type ATP synthase membrane subunit c/vacuolar-type H+-ATPase subunit K